MNEERTTVLEELRGEARVIAGELRKDAAVTAVILTGPLALGTASGADKLYFAVITDSADGVIEHHFLDEGWAGIERPIEIGTFPVQIARYLVDHGYNDMVSYKSLEAFRCGEVLWERDGIGSEIIEGSKRHIPRRAFIGESLHGAVSALDDAVSLLRNGDTANAVLVAREAVTKAVGMVIAEADIPSDTPFLEAAERVLPRNQFEALQRVLGVRDLDGDSARRKARSARDFAAYVLREIGVNPETIFKQREQE